MHDRDPGHSGRRFRIWVMKQWYIPTPEPVSERNLAGMVPKHGPYFYIIDGDPNEGHGNDLDGVDETSNPEHPIPTKRTSNS